MKKVKYFLFELLIIGLIFIVMSTMLLCMLFILSNTNKNMDIYHDKMMASAREALKKI